MKELDASQLVGAVGLVTYAEAAERLGMKEPTLRKWASRYGLTRFEWDRRFYLLEREVLECEQRRRRSGRAHQRGTTRREG